MLQILPDYFLNGGEDALEERLVEREEQEEAHPEKTTLPPQQSVEVVIPSPPEAAQLRAFYGKLVERLEGDIHVIETIGSEEATRIRMLLSEEADLLQILEGMEEVADVRSDLSAEERGLQRVTGILAFFQGRALRGGARWSKRFHLTLPASPGMRQLPLLSNVSFPEGEGGSEAAEVSLISR
ncbi:MAG: hypothetical protein ACE5IG_04380 [Dehalococcoidia bacterium]